MSAALCLLLLGLASVMGRSAATPSPEYVTVDTMYGAVRGERQRLPNEKSLDVFLGVPYAKPPVGLLRLSRPQFPTPWQGTRDALKFGNQCMQNTLVNSLPLEGVPYSEDCLYLNIYSPGTDPSTVPAPVLVWIHGGAYRFGTGSVYNGTELAARGVVVVTLNYRLDLLGYLATQDHVIPGNFGMLDQVLALEWVKDNIRAFGGDPQAVTIAGESAGSSSVSLHLLSPLSRGKFRAAIMESGVSLCPWAVNPSNVTYFSPRATARMLGLAVGCSHPASPDLLACLRTTPAQVLMNASMSLQATYRSALLWLPVQEATFLPDRPEEFYRRGDVADVPTIRGYNTNEFAYLLSDPEDQGFSSEKFRDLLIANMYYSFQKRVDDVVDAVRPVYRANFTDPKGIRADYERLVTDYEMVAAITYEAQVHSKLQKTSKTYVYEFAYRPSFSHWPQWMGVVHTDELPFVFGLPGGPSAVKINTTNPDDLQVANTMVTLWTNFVKTGDPTTQDELFYDSNDPNGLTDQLDFAWPAFNDEDNTVLRITTTPESGDFVRAKAVDLWMVRVPRLQK